MIETDLKCLPRQELFFQQFDEVEKISVCYVFVADRIDDLQIGIGVKDFSFVDTEYF